MYRFILFYFVLYICIYVAPWSCEARHLVPLYVHTCSGMTIKLNLNLNLNISIYLHVFSLLQINADAVTEMSRLLPEGQNRYCVILEKCAYFISAKEKVDI